jgi:protein-S-isoprenylcysteine O-methyltransferase Ste14
MKKFVQIILSLFTFFASFNFLFWILVGILAIPFDIEDNDPPNWIFIAARILSFSLAIYFTYYVWKRNDNKKNIDPTLGTYIITGAIG